MSETALVMSDNLTPAQRKMNMTNIRSRHTKPEIIVRSIIHSLRFRFRLHYNKLPGKPDIVLPRHRKIILIHGCFWHMHQCRFGKVIPRTNTAYWQVKREGNRERDRKNRTVLRRLRWDVFVIWECWTQDQDALRKRIEKALMTRV